MIILVVESPFLIAMDLVIGYIHVQNNLAWWLVVRVQKDIDKSLL